MSVSADSGSEGSHSWELEDPTLDLEDVRARTSVSAQLARMQANAEAGRISQRVQAVGSLLCALAILGMVIWYGSSVGRDSDQPLQRASANVAQLVPVGVAAASDAPASIAIPGPAVTPQVEASLSSSAGQGYAAPRDCMVQVESTILFRLIAKDATSRGAYNVAVNREIKRLSLRHRLRQPQTLDLIAAEVWADKSQQAATPARWTAQYRRCELRSQGAQYMARAE